MDGPLFRNFGPRNFFPPSPKLGARSPPLLSTILSAKAPSPSSHSALPDHSVSPFNGRCIAHLPQGLPPTHITLRDVVPKQEAVDGSPCPCPGPCGSDRKSTRLNSSH